MAKKAIQSSMAAAWRILICNLCALITIRAGHRLSCIIQKLIASVILQLFFRLPCAFHQPMHADLPGIPPSNRQHVYASTAQLLPPEIWTNVLSLLPRPALQHTAVSLSRALPAAEGVGGVRELFKHLRITRDIQATQLMVKLRRLGDNDGEKAKDAAMSLTSLAWR